MSGYCSIGRSNIEMIPSSTIAAASAMAKMGRAMKNFPIPAYFFNGNDPHSLTKFLQTGHSDRFSRFQARLDGPHSAERLARRNLAVFGRAVRPDYPDRRYVESLHDTLLRHQYTGQLRPDIGFDTRELSGLEPVGRIREADDQHDRPRSRRYGRPGVIVLAEKRIAGTVRLVKHDLRKQFGVVVDIRPIAVQPKELRHRNRNGDLDRINIHNRGEGRNLRTRTDIITDGAVRRFDNAVYLCIDLRVAQIELGIPQSLPGRLHVGLRSGVLRRILVELRTADGIDLGQRAPPGRNCSWLRAPAHGSTPEPLEPKAGQCNTHCRRFRKSTDPCARAYLFYSAGLRETRSHGVRPPLRYRC